MGCMIAIIVLVVKEAFEIYVNRKEILSLSTNESKISKLNQSKGQPPAPPPSFDMVPEVFIFLYFFIDTLANENKVFIHLPLF